MAIWGGAGRPLCTLRLGGISKSARTIPLTPFLPGRGNKINSGGHPQTPANGAAPLWTPAFSKGEVRISAGGAAPGLPNGGRGRAVIARSLRRGNLGRGGAAALHTPLGRHLKECSDHPPDPLPGRKGNKINSGGHPQTPANGAAPLWTPAFSKGEVRISAGGAAPGLPNGGRARVVIASRSEAIWGGAGRPLCTLRMGGVSKSARTIPLTPFLEGRGHNNELWGTPPDPCQRGCAPLDSRLHVLRGAAPGLPNGGRARVVIASRSEAIWGGAGRSLCTLRLGGVSKSARTIPLTPFLEGRGNKINSGGHPQTPANGAAPLWTPAFSKGEVRISAGGAAPGLPNGVALLWTPAFSKGEVRIGAGGTPLAPPQRGMHPSGLPAYGCWGTPYSYALNCLLSLIPWLKYDDPRSGP